MIINEKLFNYLLNNVYDAIKCHYYRYGTWGKNEYKSLKKRINKQEKYLLYKIISILYLNTLNINEENIYIACIYYYYSSLIIDNELLMFNIIDVKECADRFNIKYIIVDINIDLCWNLIKRISSSDESWASIIRKMVYFPKMLISDLN